MDMNDTISWNDEVKVQCWTCYRSYHTTVSDFEETYAKRGERFYCSPTCAFGDLE